MPLFGSEEKAPDGPRKEIATELKKIPGYSQGVRVNASLRTIKMGQPICPYSVIEMERDYKGNMVPKKGPSDPNRQNCQKQGGAWWKTCVAKGHNPYFREIVWYVTEDEFDEKTGQMIGEKKFRRAMTIPNIKQVAVSPHINSGNGARRAVTNKGCVRLNDIGYEEVCQYRNCQEPVSPSAMSKKYGNYCSTEELALIAANEQGLILARPNSMLNGVDEPKVQRMREMQLQEAIAFAKDN